MTPTPRPESWKWTVCGLLLLATMLNYMDRMTLNQTSKRIMTDFSMNKENYGTVEAAFSVAFATGAILGGLCVDRWNVWWIYPTAVFLWSLAGTVTGFAFDFLSLIACRFFLGVTEAFHWPCALRTTQRILPKDQRSLGNSILQSGAAIGAIITPIVVLYLLQRYDSWRPPFFIVGSLGIVWVVAWLSVVRRRDLALPAEGAAHEVSGSSQSTPRDTLRGVFRDPRLWVMFVVVSCLNLTWHFYRVWLPLYLQESRQLSEVQMNWFTMGYYMSADAGALIAGFTTLWLVRRGGMGVHGSRMLVFTSCAALTALGLIISAMPTGLALWACLLLIAFGSLGLFPIYYSLSQELTVKHQGKVTGILGCSTWLFLAATQPLTGRLVDETKSYSLGFTIAGILPLIAVAALTLFWREKREVQPQAPG